MSRVNDMTRAELQAELESRGFGVFENEPTGDLREALRLDRALDQECPSTIEVTEVQSVPCGGAL